MKMPLESASPLAKVWASCFLSWTFSGEKYECGMPTELPHMCNIQVVYGNQSRRATKSMRDESVKVLVAQSCPTLCNPMVCSLTGFSLSMGFSRQDCCSGLPFPSPGVLPDPGIEPRSPAMQADSLPSEPWGKPYERWKPIEKSFSFCLFVCFQLIHKACRISSPNRSNPAPGSQSAES